MHKLHSCLDEEELSAPFFLLGQRKKYFFLVVIALALAWSKKIRMFFFVIIALALAFLPTWHKKERFFEVIIMILNNRSQSIIIHVGNITIFISTLVMCVLSVKIGVLSLISDI